MKIYKIVFTNQSVINELPNSQTIFGAICTIINQTQGENDLQAYLKSFDSIPFFVHSSMFLNGTLPMLKRNLFSLNDVNEMVNASANSEKLKLLESTKKYKKISYMSEKIYKEYILNDRFEALKKDLLQHPSDFKLNNGILSFDDEELLNDVSSLIRTRNGFPEDGNDKTLFYSSMTYYPKDTEFVIYVKTNKSVDYLKSIFECFEYFGIGSRRTVGMNSFHFERIEQVSLSVNKESKLLLSRYIPYGEEVDLSKSYYQLASNVYRSSKEYVGGFVSGKYIHFLEGSWMHFTEDKEYYGRVIETQTNGKKVYHYAIGFTV